MAILRALNEFTRESCVLAIEPARICASMCTFCFAQLNQRKQYANRSKSLTDDSTFESTLEKAYNPASYDPTNFLQWGLHNRLTLGYANTVEPFQDVEQGLAILRACDQFSIPLFIQTKGYNFNHIKECLKPFYDNSSIFVSMPSLDQRVIKRFEPGTPPIEERLAMIDWLVSQDFYVIAALSPYHEQWNQDPESLVNTLASHGVSEIFFDRLHLNDRQYEAATDPVMKQMAGGTRNNSPLPWPPRAIEHLKIIHNGALANDLHFFNSGFMGTCYGYNNTLPTISPPECFSRGLAWPYHDGNVFQILEDTFYDEENDITPLRQSFDDSIKICWEDVLRIMESDFAIDQPFSYSSLYDLIPIAKHIPDVWKRSIGDPAPMRDWLRALYNSPRSNQFIWRHPWIKVACDMDGINILDTDGNLIGIFDPDWNGKPFNKHFRKVESLDSFRVLEYENI